MITTQGSWFKDEFGRTLLLRGINVGGSTKVPFKPNGATHLKEGFYDWKNVSFVGRPFPLEEADEHFSRLKSWGFNFLRFLITWEAIEHAGPGIYDEEYLDYLYTIVRKAGDYGFNLFIDPHQDVWSRFSGGDGAPAWTFELTGMDITKFSVTGAAFLHQELGDAYPRMQWSTNDTKYASATINTLFFAGDDFAPKKKIDGQPIQEFLQSHFIGAVHEVSKRLKGLPNVVGYDTYNEPSNGYIGTPDLREKIGFLHAGVFPTPWQSIQLASGFPQEVDFMVRDAIGEHITRKDLVNSGKVSLWKEGTSCVWQEEGVWRVNEAGQPELLKPDYFSQVNGKKIDFQQDYLVPFGKRFSEMIHAEDEKKIIFFEQVPENRSPVVKPGEMGQMVYASHWYDDTTLFLKAYIPSFNFDTETNKFILGEKNIRKAFARFLGTIKN